MQEVQIRYSVLGHSFHVSYTSGNDISGQYLINLTNIYNLTLLCNSAASGNLIAVKYIGLFHAYFSIYLYAKTMKFLWRHGTPLLAP